MKTVLPILGVLALTLASCQIPSVDRVPIHGRAHNVFSVDEQILGRDYTYRQGFTSGKVFLVRHGGEIVLTTHPQWFEKKDLVWFGSPVVEFGGMSPHHAMATGHLGLMIMDRGTATEHTVAVYIHHPGRMVRLL